MKRIRIKPKSSGLFFEQEQILFYYFPDFFRIIFLIRFNFSQRSFQALRIRLKPCHELIRFCGALRFLVLFLQGLLKYFVGLLPFGGRFDLTLIPMMSPIRWFRFFFFSSDARRHLCFPYFLVLVISFSLETLHILVNRPQDGFPRVYWYYIYIKGVSLLQKENCIFCKIANHEIPSHKVFETKKCWLFLISQVTKGHTLVIPKQHADNIYDLSSESGQAVFATVPEISLSNRRPVPDWTFYQIPER